MIKQRLMSFLSGDPSIGLALLRNMTPAQQQTFIMSLAEPLQRSVRAILQLSQQEQDSLVTRIRAVPPAQRTQLFDSLTPLSVEQQVAAMRRFIQTGALRAEAPQEEVMPFPENIMQGQIGETPAVPDQTWQGAWITMQ